MDQMQKAIDIVSNVKAQGVSTDQLLQTAALQNPELASMLQFINQYGDPMQGLQALARQRGFDLNQLISMYQKVIGLGKG